MFGIFRGKGVHPKENKITEDIPISKIKVPEKLFLHMSQHIGKPCMPLVKVGEKVKRFQRIGDSDSAVSAPIHSPVGGVVESIQKYPHPSGKDETAIIIKVDDAERKEPEEIKNKTSQPKQNIPKEDKEIISKIREAGIVGLGGAMFPSHIKFSIPKEKKIHTLIINGAECEPYITSDSRLMQEKSKEIIEGIKLIQKITGAENVLIGIENNKQKAIYSMRLLENGFKVVPMKTMYPKGAEKIIIKNLTGREVPSGKLPLDVGVVVSNVATCYSVYQAVFLNNPLIERVVTVTGNVKHPKNILAPLGTRFIDLIEECGGYKSTPKKIMCGGPMMGITQYTDEVPTIKGNNGVLVFNKEDSEKNHGIEIECINCGRCVDACPANLSPTTIVKYAKKGKFGFAKLNHAMDCFECGCCSYVCPSKIELTQWIKTAKNEIKK